MPIVYSFFYVKMKVNKFQQKKLQKNKKIFSISAYLDFLNTTLRDYNVKIIGEISEVNFGPTGHAYFVLKDKKDGSIIKCVIWKRKYDIYGIELKEGIEIIASGFPNVHSQYGFKFIAELIEYAGEGVLKEEYERLKKRLTEEGVFDKKRKRPIPEYPRRIGVITSKTGAVIHDFTTNLGKFGFIIKMVDSRVEGQDAVEGILHSLNLFRKQNIDILVIMRGGGSFESLLAFNNEQIVREVVKFPVPVIAAIGHEKNIPLMSLASDIMVSTPTAAANLLSEPWKQAWFRLEKYEKNILNLYNKNLLETKSILNEYHYELKERFSSILGKHRELENKLKTFLYSVNNQLILIRRDVINISKSVIKDFSFKLRNLYREIDSIDFHSVFQNKLELEEDNIIGSSKSILKYFAFKLNDVDNKIFNIKKIINSHNPERQLKLGYSITKHKKMLIKNIKDVKIGDDIEVQVFNGFIQSKVKNINKKYA